MTQILYPLLTFEPLSFTVPVIHGAGSQVFPLAGFIFNTFTRIAVIPPNPSYTFSMEIVDHNNVGCWGTPPQTGPTTLLINEDFYGKLTFSIENASGDGDYETFIWYR